jgi:DNA-binding MarR family transcriptional regulator
VKGNFDKAFENIVRLRVMSVLMANEQYDFNGFKELMEVTDGNLSSHLRTLEKQGYVVVEKSFIGRKPQSNYSATPAGREAFQRHLDYLENLINQNKT